MIEMKPLLLGVDKSINKCASLFDSSHFVGVITFPPPKPLSSTPTPTKTLNIFRLSFVTVMLAFISSLWTKGLV